MIRARNVALLYVLFATLAALLLAATMPPMQNADEANHAYRADQISHLGLLATRIADGEVGGLVDSGLPALQARMVAIPFHQQVKATGAMFLPVPWGTPQPAGFPNTAVYPPFFYLPAAAMAVLARWTDCTLPQALVLMRLAMAVVSIAVGGVAIALAGSAAIWLFAILLLPMSLALTAAVTQDGPMLATTALAVSLFIFMQTAQPRLRHTAFMLMVLLLALVGMARPPYAAFALLVLGAPVGRFWRIAGLAGLLVCVAAWSFYNAPFVVLPPRPNGVVDPGAQLRGMALHPWRLLPLAIATWHAVGADVRQTFIGCLGWLDVDLPPLYHHIARAGLVVAALAALCAGSGPWQKRGAALAGLAVIGAAAGIALIQYLIWTVVGAPVVDGLVGRYFLAPALLLGIALAHPAVAPAGTMRRRAASVLAIPVLALPVISIAVTMYAILLRYYN
jgi:hypothetical protein